MTPAADSTCTLLQVEAYKYCQCPTLPEGHCQLCEYTNDEYLPLEFPNLDIPDSANNCSQLEFKGFPPCIQDDAVRWFCGCPNTVRPNDCRLCNALQNGPLPLPPLFSKTCQALDREGALLDSCDALTAGLPTGFDVEGYCGCSDNPAVGSCPICGQGVPILNPNAIVQNNFKCSQLEAMAGFADATYCSELQSNYATLCCEPIEEEPIIVDEPTLAPATAPTSASREWHEVARGMVLITLVWAMV